MVAMKRATFLSAILLCGVLVEALLALRVWAQLTGRPIESEEMSLLFRVTRELASPLVLVTHEAPRETTGIVDFTVLVAMEAYLIGMLTLIASYFVVCGTLSLFSHEPADVREPRSDSDEVPHWQPVRSPRSFGSTYYLSMQSPAMHPVPRKTTRKT
jgi:hypothetical protein